GAHRQPVRPAGHAHGPLEVVKGQGKGPLLIHADHDELARLVGGDDQRGPKVGQQRGEVTGILVADFAVGGGGTTLRRLGTRIVLVRHGAPPTDGLTGWWNNRSGVEAKGLGGTRPPVTRE